jgi:hypothetical protein
LRFLRLGIIEPKYCIHKIVCDTAKQSKFFSLKNKNEAAFPKARAKRNKVNYSGCGFLSPRDDPATLFSPSLSLSRPLLQKSFFY